MPRWEPDGRRRLEEAALELYGERGFENTTVTEIAARAGLTERTFFRYFADKREVLFGGASALAVRLKRTAFAGRLSFINPQLEWATALTTPVIMSSGKARRELGWKPRFDAGETLTQTAIAARETGLLD